MVAMEGIDMTDAEKKCIAELKKKLSSDVDQKICSDTYLLYRFLYANNFNLCSAENVIKKMCTWRNQLKADSILEDFEPLEVLKKHLGETRFAQSKTGNAVHYIPIGKLDTKGLLSSSKYADVEKFVVRVLERDEQTLKKMRKTKDGPYPGNIFIFDMDSLDFATATDKKALETVIRILKMNQTFYPGRLEVIYVINAFPFFYMAYSMIKNFLNADFVKLINIFGTEGWQEELLKIIDADELPKFLGGNKTDPDGNQLCKTIVCQGGKVSEKYYLPKSKKELSKHPEAKKLVLSRASFLEIEVEIQEPGSLIEWEFETKTCDVGFGLFHKEMVDGEEKITELVPLLRLDTESYAETGMYKCQLAGTYIILFDNSYSWIRSKEIYYRLKIISPKEHENQLQ